MRQVGNFTVVASACHKLSLDNFRLATMFNRLWVVSGPGRARNNPQ